MGLVTEGILTAEEYADHLNECYARMYQIGYQTDNEELQDLVMQARSLCSKLWTDVVEIDATELLDELDQNHMTEN